MKLTDKLYVLGSVIPACVCFGPLFLSNQWGPWLPIVSLNSMYLYITRLHTRIGALETRLPEMVPE